MNFGFIMAIYFIKHSDKAQDSRARRSVAKSESVKIYRGIYSDDITTPIQEQIRSNIIPIVKHLFPNSMISHRSAANLKVEDGKFFLTGKNNYQHKLAGVTIIQSKGPGPLKSDPIYIGYPCSSESRYLLENLQIDRGLKKSLGQAWVEEKLDQLINISDESRINEIRDNARQIAKQFQWDKPFNKLDNIIGCLQGTREASLLTTRAKARASGEAFDNDRISLFEQLAVFLHRCDFKQRKPQLSNELASIELAFSNAAFWDAYFSNYIEGTAFDIEEAEEIIYERKESEGRHEDSHNILRSYDLLSSRDKMNRAHKTPEEFIETIKYYHRYFMAESTEKTPGEFKVKPNRAGNTHFVLPALVEGTFIRIYPMINEFRCPFKRAVFCMFIVAEIHPFIDGNGRIARMIMNSELIKGGLERIIIPTIYREDYLGGLRAVSHNQDFVAYCRMLDRAHYFTARFDYSDANTIKEEFIRIGIERHDKEALLPAYNYRNEMSDIPSL